MSSGFSVFFAVLDSVLWRCCGCKMAVKTQDQCIQEQVQKHPVQPKLNSVHLKGACCPMCISQLTYTKLHSSQMNLLTLPKQFSVFSPPLLAWWWVPLSIIFFFFTQIPHILPALAQAPQIQSTLQCFPPHLKYAPTCSYQIFCS